LGPSNAGTTHRHRPQALDEDAPIFAPANNISAAVVMLKIAPGGNSITPFEFRGSQNGSRYEATLWRRADQRFSLLKHRGGEIAPTDSTLIRTAYRSIN
ncbi:MAG: hypothetical protein WBD95_13895, partial [Xanthobacteraceae bacterium]